MRSSGSHGVLVELFDLPADEAAAWRGWYDEHLLTPRSAVGGVIAARRGKGVVGKPDQPIPEASPLEVGVYDLQDLSAVDSEAWRTVDERVNAGPPGPAAEAFRSGQRRLYRQIWSSVDAYEPPVAQILHGAFFEIPSTHHEEFNDWYEMEHLPAQLEVSGYVNARRFQGMVEPDQFVALYDVLEFAVTQTQAAADAMRSPWGDRIRAKLARNRARRLFEVDRLERASSSGH